MNRKAELFFDAITLLREDLVEEAQNYVFRRKGRGWRKFGSLAACALLVVSLGMLAVLPRGCGAGAGSGANTSDSSGSSNAPAQIAPGVDWDAPSGESAPSAGGDMNGAPPPAAVPGEVGPNYGNGLIEFSGRVLEVLEDALLVADFGGSPEIPALVRVPTAGLEGLPEFHLGDVVLVTCRDFVWESGAALAEGVTGIDPAEPQNNGKRPPGFVPGGRLRKENLLKNPLDVFDSFISLPDNSAPESASVHPCPLYG